MWARGRGEEDAVAVGEHVGHFFIICSVDFVFPGGRFAVQVVVDDAHTEGGAGFLCDDEADEAEADDAEGVAGGVVRDEGDGGVGFAEEGGGAGARGEGGVGGVGEDGDEVVEGGVADGFGGGVGAVGVDDACSGERRRQRSEW